MDGVEIIADEDIVDEVRRKEVHELTDALAVAWEGIGGARACAFSHIPFVEIRGITDVANADARSSFKAHLERVMAHVAAFIVAWVTVGIAQFPAEAAILGRRFSVARNIISFILSIIVAISTVLVLGVLT